MNGKQVNLIDFADYLVRYFEVEKGDPITNLSLQKILYYIQAYHLVYFDKNPLFDVEAEAWVKGPVYRQVYFEYRDYGSTEIEVSDSDFEKAKEQYQDAVKKLSLDDEQLNYISYATTFFGNMTPNELIFRTHSEAPWVDARSGLGPLDACDKRIQHDEMHKYYGALVEEKRQAKEQTTQN